ncbi:hypothetical protein [Lacipirellula parvula]|uniref:PEP-CTERM protein-sorting domain-containing protein n=1 Tax=Lacipirellula parvula TaxID=2650471 RepID=A0A5K7XDJ7_9BACT|nr:hypothetical protein [Lacipirellula parvula]BBO32911.1 hypothetical protein PLANPX_2523 [Lacipirellula parvula]
MIRFRLLVFGFAIAIVGGPSFAADSFVIEPDDYADGTVLNDVNPRVKLRIFDGVLSTSFPTDFGVFPDPGIIAVTALTNDSVLGGYYTSTGTKSFGHYLIGFTPESRQIAMQFMGAASSVSVDVIGRSDLSSAIGTLEVFSPNGTLLETVFSPPLGRQQVATLSISRPIADIGYARAFSSPQGSLFGSFDYLRFTSVPEPPGVSLMAFGLFVCARRRERVDL